MPINHHCAQRNAAHGAGGSQRSLLEGSISKGLISFAVPIFLGNLFQQLYNSADAIIVGNFISKDALAAVSSSGNLIFMIVGLLNGIAMGAGVVIAKSFGAKDKEKMQIAIHTDLAFGIAAGIVLTVLGAALTPVLLRWMGTPEDVLPNSIAYFRTYFFGATAMVMYNITTGILHAVGDSRHPLYYLIISSITNIVLDLLFVAVLKLGVASAAAATAISQALSATLCLIRLARYNTDYQVKLKQIRFNFPMLGQIIRFGLPSGVQNSVIGFANVIVQKNINAFGADAMAGCGSYTKIEGFAFLPVTCFAMGLATFVGQNLGAKQYDRVKRGNRFGIICSITMAEIIGVIIYIFSPYLIAAFNSDPAVVAFGVRQSHIESLFFCFLAYSHCMAGIMRGSGKATVPMLVMLICWCVVRVTYITVMINHVWNDISVVFSAYPLTWTLSSIVFTIYYLKADWLHGFDKLETRRKSA